MFVAICYAVARVAKIKLFRENSNTWVLSNNGYDII